MQRHSALTDAAILAHIKERYAEKIGAVDLVISGDRRFTGEDDNGHVVINAYPVGPNNAGDYEHWLAMPKPAWGRLFGPKPEGWKHYILMVGLQPDGKSIWWTIMYDEQAVAALDLEPEYIRRGYGRLRPDEVRSTIVHGPFNELQMSLGLDTAPTCDHRGVALYSMEDAGEPDMWACSRCGAAFRLSPVAAA